MADKLHPSAKECPACHEIYSKFLGHVCEVEGGKNIKAQKKQQVRQSKGTHKEATVKRTRKPKNTDKEGLK